METSHKTVTTTNGNYFFNRLFKSTTLCLKGKSFSLLPLLSSLEPWYSLVSHVLPALKIGRAALQAHVSNKRHLVGDVFICLGGFSLVFHQLFSKSVMDLQWYYVNWYYFFYAVRPFVMGLFFSVSAYCYASKTSGMMLFGVMHCIAWCGIIHYSFFVYDFTTYHSFPIWSVWLLAFGWGTGFLLGVHHLAYLWEHKWKGNHKRFVGLAEMDLTKVDRDLRDRMLRDNANEYRNMYKHY